MTTLDTVIEMQRKGMTDFEISQTLQSQGISPRDINDSINQAKIKNAIDQNPNINTNRQTMNKQNPNLNNQYAVEGLPPHPPTGPAINPQTNRMIIDPIANMPPTNPATGPQPSVMQNAPYPVAYPIENIYPQDQYADPYAGQEGQPPQQEYYGDEYYQDGYYDDGGGYGDTETITDIAGQVVNEKFKEYNEKTGDMVMFKNTISDKVAIMEERIKRMEDNIDKLQQAIIQKIGEFGENTSMIRKDLENLHNTTSKLMNPLIDNIRELEKRK